MRGGERWLVGAGVLVLILITFLAALASSRTSTDRAAREQLEDVVERAASAASNEARVFLRPASRAATFSAELFATDVLSEGEPDRLEAYLLGQLHDPQGLIAGVFIGRPDGDFFYVNRADDVSPGGTRTKVIDVEGEERSVQLWWRDANRNLVRSATDPDDTYDPRTRPWFTQALQADGPVWTEPYVFFSSGQPGITVATRVPDAAPDEDGVFGVDIEIEALGDLLRQVRITEHGAAFIIGPDGQFVAASALESVAVTSRGEVRRASVADVSEPALVAAEAALRRAGGPTVSEPVLATFEVDGEPWVARFTRFADENWPWTMAVYAPEADFLTGVRQVQRANAQLAVLMPMAGALLLLALTTWITRPFSRWRDATLADDLTGVGNRRWLETEGARIVDRHRERRAPFAVVIVDIDHFRRVVASHGPTAGSEVVQAIAARLERSVKESDLLARVDGDVLALVLGDIPWNKCALVGERLRAVIESAPVTTNTGEAPVTASIGIAASAQDDDRSLEQLLAAAAAAKVQAKEGGRNRVVLVGAPAGVVS